MLYLCFLILLLHGVVDGVVDCTGKVDGNYEVTCTGYTRCTNGVLSVHTCAVGQMYNPVTMVCASTTNLPPPCAIVRNCPAMVNKRFADLETNCQSYYTCHGGNFFGHNFCNPGLVFDEENQLCNWPDNVAKPCGNRDPVLVG